MLHQPHAGVTGPALLVVVAHDVLVVGVRVLGQVPLDQISGLVSREPSGATEKQFDFWFQLGLQRGGNIPVNLQKVSGKYPWKL